MAKNYNRTCDVCKKTLYAGNGPWYDWFLPRVKHMSFNPFSPMSWRSRREDVCSNCWDDIKEYIKLKRNVQDIG